MPTRPGGWWPRGGAGSDAPPATVLSSATPTCEDGSDGARSAPVDARLMTSRAMSARVAALSCGTRILSSLPTGDTGPDASRTATIVEATGPRQHSSRRPNRRACVNRCVRAVLLLLVLMATFLVGPSRDGSDALDRGCLLLRDARLRRAHAPLAIASGGPSLERWIDRGLRTGVMLGERLRLRVRHCRTASDSASSL